jgi:membrane protease YdiL (CAAX protease family)
MTFLPLRWPAINININYLDVKILSTGARVKRLFLDSNGRLRNGWWILVFLALMVASRWAYTPASRALQQLGVGRDWLEPLRFAFLLLVTWLCVRLRGERLSSVGFVLDARWGRQFGAGAAIGLGTALLAVLLIWAVGGVRFELDPARSVGTLAFGAYLFLFVAMFEETLFRGFVFQRFVAGAGTWVAQVTLGLLFAAGHWANPDMHGATLAWASADLFLGALLLGLAYLRTRSLALPVGIHLGWNWAQGYLLGFDVSGFDHAGWFRPLLQARPDWVTGGSFGPEASAFAVLVDAVQVLGLWKWKGTLPREPAYRSRDVSASAASTAASVA